ncbi:hypothetical protein F7732_11350 [Bacillus mesophilum]|uniref:Uncharacterized protein n=1 Tax=Bacillus mesophilum TaxID=1071718 RepID=A0A7V7RLP5_9BACI|nr:hypothetical protein F7732_11350 [Bacillus mesophilum]
MNSTCKWDYFSNMPVDRNGMVRDSCGTSGKVRSRRCAAPRKLTTRPAESECHAVKITHPLFPLCKLTLQKEINEEYYLSFCIH